MQDARSFAALRCKTVPLCSDLINSLATGRLADLTPNA